MIAERILKTQSGQTAVESLAAAPYFEFQRGIYISSNSWACPSILKTLSINPDLYYRRFYFGIACYAPTAFNFEGEIRFLKQGNLRGAFPFSINSRPGVSSFNVNERNSCGPSFRVRNFQENSTDNGIALQDGAPTANCWVEMFTYADATPTYWVSALEMAPQFVTVEADKIDIFTTKFEATGDDNAWNLAIGCYSQNQPF